MQIALHREFPVKPRAFLRFEQKIAFAKRDARAPQRHTGRDEPRRRSVLQKPAQQAFGASGQAA